jgi:hypothetical protein
MKSRFPKRKVWACPVFSGSEEGIISGLFGFKVGWGLVVKTGVVSGAGELSAAIASSEKIKRELGWQLKFQSLETIIESAWKWHQKFPRGYGD